MCHGGLLLGLYKNICIHVHKNVLTWGLKSYTAKRHHTHFYIPKTGNCGPLQNVDPTIYGSYVLVLIEFKWSTLRMVVRVGSFWKPNDILAESNVWISLYQIQTTSFFWLWLNSIFYILNNVIFLSSFYNDIDHDMWIKAPDIVQSSRRFKSYTLCQFHNILFCNYTQIFFSLWDLLSLATLRSQDVSQWDCFVLTESFWASHIRAIYTRKTTGRLHKPWLT